jgi:hypothetical protein
MLLLFLRQVVKHFNQNTQNTNNFDLGCTFYSPFGPAHHDASRKLLTLGVRFGEADQPGPGENIFSAHVANYVWPHKLGWELESVGKPVYSEAVDDFLALESCMLCPSPRMQMIMDSGANIFFTPLVDECDEAENFGNCELPHTRLSRESRKVKTKQRD